MAREDDELGVTDLLAGDFIGAFGGFLSRDIRRNDYALGWTAAERWADEGGRGDIRVETRRAFAALDRTTSTRGIDS